MFNLRCLLALLVLISVIALTTVIYRHLQQRSPEEILNLLPDDIDLALEDLHYTQNEDGRRSWTLDADKAEYQRDSSLAKLEAVKLRFYAAGQFGDINLRADEGQLAQDTRQVDIWGNVILTSGRGDQLFTERLHYDDQARQLSTEEPIRYISPQLELTGTGLQIDIDQGRMVVNTKVWMRLFPASMEKN